MRGTRPVLSLAATVLLALPASAMAQGMPQLNFNNPLTLSQVWWGAIIFVVFLLLCWLWGLPQVASVLERRSAAIAADLETARQSKTKADQFVAETQQAIARARAEAQGQINSALEAARQQAAAQSAELHARLEAQIKESEARIDQARQTALRALRQVATETAAAVVTRLTGTTPPPARLEQAVSMALAARAQREGG
jgi:F-type H+-transporting ATPase subunit b